MIERSDQTPREIPLPHQCRYPDAEVLLEDVRQSRRRRWWLTTVVVLALVASLGGLGVWIFSVGEQVGSARTEMGYMQRAADSDRINISKNSEATRLIERESTIRYSEIQQVLIRIDGRLENLEKTMSKRR